MKSFYNSQLALKQRQNMMQSLFTKKSPLIDEHLNIELNEIAWGIEGEEADGFPKILTSLNGYDGVGDFKALNERDNLIVKGFDKDTADRLVTEALMSTLIVRGVTTQSTNAPNDGLRYEKETNLQINGICKQHGFNDTFTGDLLEAYIPTTKEFAKVDDAQMKRLGVLPGKAILWLRSFNSRDVTTMALDHLRMYLEDPTTYHQIFSGEYSKINVVRIQAMCNLVYFVLFAAATGAAKLVENGVLRPGIPASESDLASALYSQDRSVVADGDQVWIELMGLFGLYKLSQKTPEYGNPNPLVRFDGRLNQLLRNPVEGAQFQNNQKKVLKDIIESVLVHPMIIAENRLIGYRNNRNLLRIRPTAGSTLEDVDLTREGGRAQVFQTRAFSKFAASWSDMELIRKRNIVGMCTKGGGGPNFVSLEMYHTQKSF